jgi:DNA-binding response OmpR family regulator
MTLIVHEDATARARIAERLRAEGFETDDADDGYEAIRKVWQGHYDTVVAAAGLRRMEGRRLASHLREIAPEVKVVFLEPDRAR